MTGYNHWRVARRLTAWRDSDTARAFHIERMLQDKSVSITVIREMADTQKLTKLAPQQVRIEPIDNVPFERQASGKNAFVNGLRILVIGYHNHPGIPDTDIQFGDRFTHEEQSFEVLQREAGFENRAIWIAEARD